MTSRLNAQPDGFRLPDSLGLDSEAEAELREQAWAVVTRGVDDPFEFVDWATASELLDEPRAEQVWQLVLDARRAQQALWGDTPRTALTDAFAELETLGVVARQNFSCCGTCASGEIWDERPADRPSRGYVYFHMQDTEQLIESNSTYLGYGAFPDAYLSEAEWNALDEPAQNEFYERTTTALMDEVVTPTLTRHGIQVVWNHRLDTRILIENAEYFEAV
ncbi:hypothetical protein GCM10027515_03630 [Schumannella luteola]|uniref:DUF6891 domain-containing protein n=1 Tax=Schumannella luteola TaxID=472059 RepID=A0A852YBC8_9MICO|nr:hypothetical protein [Schumannella luteola]NYG98501.1 hypothetical protein [Schumannella luteola]TPX01275.1 hypothetical protein FJ656_28190 [Schumannella luteola]